MGELVRYSRWGRRTSPQRSSRLGARTAPLTYLVRLGDGHERLAFPGTDCQVLHDDNSETSSGDLEAGTKDPTLPAVNLGVGPTNPAIQCSAVTEL